MMNDDVIRPVTYAFVDAANIIYRDSEPNPWKIDLRKLIKYLRERFDVSRVLYFGGIDDRNKKQVHFYRKLKSWGYELYLNPVKRFINERGECYIKADVDSRMTYEMMNMLSAYDRAVILTGDGDFFWVLENLFREKKHPWLLASPRKTAKELKQLFSHRFVNFDDARPWLEYTDDKNEADPLEVSASRYYRNMITYILNPSTK